MVALGILAVSYPTFLAATRREAILGIVAALFVAADAFLLVSLVARDEVLVHPLGRSFALGLVAIALAVPVAIAATLIGSHFGARLRPLDGSPVGDQRGRPGLIVVVVAAYSI